MPDKIPIEVGIKPYTNPTMMSNVGRDKIAFGLRIHQHILKNWRRFTPQRRATLHTVLHGENLAPHFEDRFADAALVLFGCLWQSEAHRMKQMNWLRIHRGLAPFWAESSSINSSMIRHRHSQQFA